MLESLVGAVYVDTGGQLDTVWAVTQVGQPGATLCCPFLGHKQRSPACLIVHPPIPALSSPVQRLLDPLVTPDTLPVHPIRKLQVDGGVGLGPREMPGAECAEAECGWETADGGVLACALH